MRALWSLHEAKPTEPTQLPAQPHVTIQVVLDGGWHQRHPNKDAEIADQALMLRDLIGDQFFFATFAMATDTATSLP